LLRDLVVVFATLRHINWNSFIIIIIIIIIIIKLESNLWWGQCCGLDFSLHW